MKRDTVRPTTHAWVAVRASRLFLSERALQQERPLLAPVVASLFIDQLRFGAVIFDIRTRAKPLRIERIGRSVAITREWKKSSGMRDGTTARLRLTIVDAVFKKVRRIPFSPTDQSHAIRYRDPQVTGAVTSLFAPLH
jgi:hypothetical protein